MSEELLVLVVVDVGVLLLLLQSVEVRETRLVILVAFDGVVSLAAPVLVVDG